MKYGEAFIGAAGQSLRRVLYQHVHGRPMPDFEAGRAVGRGFFWCNTVPYKPTGNRAWSMAVKRRFHPVMRRLLLDSWHGQDLITLGREAFFWFALDQPPQIGRQLDVFWTREQRFTASLEVPLGDGRCLRLHPLPHPSPLNQGWFERFPALLQARLQALG